MPPKYYKKTYRKKMYGNATKSDAKKIAIREIRKAVGKVETKQFPVHQAPVSVTTTHYDQVLNAPPRGTDIDERIGRDITNTYVDIRMTLQMNAAVNNQALRVVLLIDRQANEASSVTTASVWDSAMTLISQRNPSTLDRYKILYDKVILLDDGDLVFKVLHIRKKIPKYLQSVNFDAADAVDGSSNINNALWLVVVSDSATNSPSMAYNSIVYFKDD